MRIWSRLPLVAVLGAAATLAMATPAMAAASPTSLSNNCNQLPEVPYAALVPVAGIGAVMLLRRLHARCARSGPAALLGHPYGRRASSR